MQQIERLNRLIEHEQSTKGRALVLWIENEGEWTVDTLQHVLNDEVHVRELSTRNILKLKIEIEREKTDASFVLYAPKKVESDVLEPLLSIQYAGVTFKGDDVAALAEKLRMDEMTLRRLQNKYPKFFNANSRLVKLEKIKAMHTVEVDERMLLAVLTNSSPAPEDIFVSLARQGKDVTEQRYLQDIKKMDLLSALIEQLEVALGIEGLTEEGILTQSIDVIIASSYFRDGGVVTRKLKFLQSNKQNQLAVLYAKLLEDKSTRSQWKQWTREWIERYDILFYLTERTTKDLLQFKTLVAADLVLLERIKQDATSVPIESNIDEWITVIEQRQQTEAYDQHAYIQEQYHFFHYYILLRNQLNAIVHHIDILPTTLDELYQEYILSEYEIDLRYRQLAAMMGYLQDEVLETLYLAIQLRYERDYLAKRAEQASNLAQQNKEKKGLTGQTAFYNQYVRIPKLQTKARQFVIISDAFRYEAGKELTERLQQMLNASVICEAMEASAPTYTQLGMASLLPQIGELSMTDAGVVMLGELSTSGLKNRERLLNQGTEQTDSAIALKLVEFSQLLGRERKELIKSKQVVYLYHDTIDAIGDKMATEHKTFEATANAIDELTRAVQLLLTLDAKRITITADHGYLYVNEQAGAHSKIIGDKSHILTGNSRFGLARKDEIDRFEGSFKLAEVDQVIKQTDTYIAEGLNRFTSGAGTRFMHGGVTPQERIVPVVIVEAGTDTKQVEVTIVDSSRTITDWKPKFELYQSELIQVGIRPLVVRASLYRETERVSNSVRMIFAAKNRNDQRQTIELSLFEGDYPLHSPIALVLETPDGQGQWKRYKTIDFKVSILGGSNNG